MIPKFRVWGNIRKEFINYCDVRMELTTGRIYAGDMNYPGAMIDITDGVVLMQSTCLKDKNDVEIYDGDIVVNHARDVWVITYFRGAFRYYPIDSFSKEKEGLFETDNIGNFDTKTFEVLGNVYENYELLEAMK